MTTAAIAGFVRHPEHTKPGVRMPAFPQMTETEAVRIARYLDRVHREVFAPSVHEN